MVCFKANFLQVKSKAAWCILTSQVIANAAQEQVMLLFILHWLTAWLAAVLYCLNVGVLVLAWASDVCFQVFLCTRSLYACIVPYGWLGLLI